MQSAICLYLLVGIYFIIALQEGILRIKCRPEVKGFCKYKIIHNVWWHMGAEVWTMGKQKIKENVNVVEMSIGNG